MKLIALPFAASLCLALMATSAKAAIPELRYQREGVDIQLSGGISLQSARIDDSSQRGRSQDSQQEGYLRFNAEWTSPTGLLFGLNLEQSNSDRETEALQTGEVYGFVASELGRIEVGKQDGGADALAFKAPVIALGQIRGDFSRYGGSQALLTPTDTGDAFKLIYLSPPVGGLRAAISWAPEYKRNEDAANPLFRTLVDDTVEVGLQYQKPVADWVLGVSAGYVDGKAQAITGRQDLKSWSVGAEARRGPLRVGGSYVDRGDSNRQTAGFDQWEVNGGVAWVADKWGVSASAAYADASSQTNHTYGIGGYYSLNDHVQLRADLVRFDEQRTGARRERGTIGLAEIALSF